MAGKHSRDHWWRRSRHQGAHWRGGSRPLGIVDSHTGIEHLMTDEAAARWRRTGRYVALCGAQVLAASLTAPNRGQCPMCAVGAAQ